MRRATLVLALVLLALAGCDEGTTDPDRPPHLLGDVNGDGVVNVIDVQQLARWVGGYEVDFPVGEVVVCW